jgi:Stage II sporulation protein M
MSVLDRHYFRDTELALLAFIGLSVPIAAVVAADDPGRERATLHYGFASTPHAAGQLLAILAANFTLLGAYLAAAMLVQARWACRTRTGRTAFTGFCDLIVALPTLHNLVFVLGTTVGAYGLRMLRSMLPAGPLELTAYALAAAVYLRSRRTRIDRRMAPETAAAALLACATLLIAALVETYL